MKQIFNKLKEINETLLACSIVLIGVFAVFVFYGFKYDDSFGFKCPSDFKTSEKYLDSVDQWVSRYTKKHPEANAEEMMAVRDELIEKHKCEKTPFTVVDDSTSDADIKDTDKVDMDKLWEAIKYAESQRSPGIGENPTEEEIYNNPYIKHVRTALDGYLAGTNEGVETDNLLLAGGALEESISGSVWCGLKKFDKSYYKSKFIIYDGDASNYELGGVQAYIVFVDNPDTIFWAVTYQYAGGEYILRRFCGVGPTEEYKDEWPERIRKIIKESKFSL